MAITDQLGRPLATTVVEGKFSLMRYHRIEATVAAPVTAVNVYGVQNVTANPVSFDNEFKVFQQGGGEDYYLRQSGPRWDGTIQIEAGKVGELLVGLLGYTWGVATSGNTTMAGIPGKMADYPLAHLEIVYRGADNTDQLFTMVYQDVIFDNFNLQSPMDRQIVDLPFHSYHDPVILADSTELVFDKYTGDGSTLIFTASSVPIVITDADESARNRDDWELDNAFFVATQTTSQISPVRETSGVTFAASKALTYTTAPAASSEVHLLYVKD